MAASQFSEAIQILKQEADEEKNWRTSRARLGELFIKAQEAEKLLPKVASLEDKAKQLEASNASAEARLTERTIKNGKLDTIEMLDQRIHDLQTVIATREASLEKLDRALVDKEKKFAELEKEIATFKTKHALV